MFWHPKSACRCRTESRRGPCYLPHVTYSPDQLMEYGKFSGVSRSAGIGKGREGIEKQGDTSKGQMATPVDEPNLRDRVIDHLSIVVTLFPNMRSVDA